MDQQQVCYWPKSNTKSHLFRTICTRNVVSWPQYRPLLQAPMRYPVLPYRISLFRNQYHYARIPTASTDMWYGPTPYPVLSYAARYLATVCYAMSGTDIQLVLGGSPRHGACRVLHPSP
eukprot:3004131-Rhodomonas_salina.1